MPANKSPTERFSSRVADYVRYRPSYPRDALELLQRRCGLAAGAVVADLGSGTGILTQLLLESGAEVIGVEPNDGMRAAAEHALAGNRRFRSLRGCAEASTLASGSVDLLVAGQAFHWFERGRRAPRGPAGAAPGGFGALLWNEHPSAGSALPRRLRGAGAPACARIRPGHRQPRR